MVIHKDMIDRLLYGCCTLSWLPLRADASHRSEMVSQVLFGESFRILDLQGEWCRIETDTDHYRGFVAMHSFEPVPTEEWEAMQSHYRTATSFLQLTDRRNRQTFCIPPSAKLPQMEGNCVKIGRCLFETAGLPPETDLRKSIGLYQRAPYLWGGRTPWGIDCSGFTQAIYSLQRIQLPRDAAQQIECGAPIPPGEARLGDLAFFHNEQGNIVHVGLILDRQHLVHASRYVHTDRWDSHGILWGAYDSLFFPHETNPSAAEASGLPESSTCTEKTVCTESSARPDNTACPESSACPESNARPDRRYSHLLHSIRRIR